MDIPREPLHTGFRHNGFLPLVGLHRHGARYRQESSYAQIWFAVMVPLLIAITLHFLPWGSEATSFLNLSASDAFVLVFLWGGCCSLLVYFLRNKWGLLVTIDPDNRILKLLIRNGSREKGGIHVSKEEQEISIPWNRIVALQICHNTDPHRQNYQLNLVWQDQTGTMLRHCLATHGTKRFMISLGRRYESLFGFKLIEHSQA